MGPHTDADRRRPDAIVDVGVSAEFDGKTISGNAGCNAYNASYEASGSAISFGPIAATKKLCPEAEQTPKTGTSSSSPASAPMR